MSPYTCPQGHTSESGDYCDTCGAPIAQGASGPGSAGSGAAAGAATGSASGSASGAALATGLGDGTAPGTGSGAGAATAGPRVCPNCSSDNTADALFCEACGYDFTTGTLPRPPEVAAAAGAGSSSLDLGPSTPSGGQPVQAAGGEAPDGQAAPGGAAAAAAPVAPPVPLEWVAEVWVDPDWYAVQESEQVCPSPGPPQVVPLTLQSVLVGRRSASRNIHPQVDCSADTGVSRRQAQLTTDGQRWWVEDLQSSNGTYVGPASGPLPEDPLPAGQRRELDEDDRIYVGAWTRLVVRRATAEEQAAHA